MLSEALTLGSRWTFVGGKGGVGKTTVAAAVAVERADQGENVLVVSIDPAHSLGDALEVPLGPDPQPVFGLDTLTAMEVNASVEKDRFFAEWGASVATLIERGTYLDRRDVDEVTAGAVPGMDEIAAMLRLARIAATARGRVIIDTAPTGHTLRFFDLPDLTLRWLDAFDAMERKHAAVAVGLTGNYSTDAAAQFLESLREDVEKVRSLLRSPSETRMVLVTTDERVVIAETLRYQEALNRMGIALGGIVVNGSCDPPNSAKSARMVFVPRLDVNPVGLDGLRRFGAAAGQAATENAQAETSSLSLVPFAPPMDRSLYMVGGKGGVGKTTAAAALAIHLSTHGRRALLLSVDPAGSLADVLVSPVGADATAVPGIDGLSARQIDAVAAWNEYASQYRQKVRGLFERMVSPGLGADVDREVVERLIDLAPPGIDELVGLMEVVDSTEDREYDALVVDTAPTGHLLRLLETPAIALEWCHTLMRLLLRYRGAVRMGDLGADVLHLAQRIRAFQDRLADRRETWFLAVARPEALSIPETERLVGGLRAVGVVPGALLINRSTEAGRLAAERSHLVTRLIDVAPGIPTILAPDLPVPPTGAASLAHYLREWRMVAGTHVMS